MFGKADTVEFERSEGEPESIAFARRLETAGLIEIYGPFVEGHSAVETSVFPSQEDETRIAQVLALIHPNAARGDTRTAAHNLRDAMHVATAIRYGWNGFVTVDNAVLGAVAVVRREWGFSIFSPSGAVTWVLDEVAKRERREQRMRDLMGRPQIV